jgi:hypothetical protein
MLLLSLLTFSCTAALALAFGSAAAFACTSPGYYFDGMIHTESLTGAHADVDRYKPRMCASSSAYAMVDNTNYGTALAQIGWVKYSAWSTTAVFYFYEYGTSSNLNNPVPLTEVPSPGTLRQDKFGVQDESGTFYFRLNSTTEVTETPGWTPNQGFWAAETHSYSDQTAGDLSNLDLFSGVQHYSGGAWHDDTPASSYAYNTSPYGSGYWGSSNSFDTYDSRYSSEG